MTRIEPLPGQAYPTEMRAAMSALHPPILVTNHSGLVVAHSRATCSGSWHVIPP